MKESSQLINHILDPVKEKVQALEKSYKMESIKIETLLKEILKVVKRTDNKLERIEDKLNKLEHIMVNIEIQQNTLISIGKDPKHVKGTMGKIVKQIIFRNYLERTIKKEDIEKGSLNEKLLEQYLELERKRKIKEGKQVIEKETIYGRYKNKCAKSVKLK